MLELFQGYSHYMKPLTVWWYSSQQIALPMLTQNVISYIRGIHQGKEKSILESTSALQYYNSRSVLINKENVQFFTLVKIIQAASTPFLWSVQETLQFSSNTSPTFNCLSLPYYRLGNANTLTWVIGYPPETAPLQRPPVATGYARTCLQCWPYRHVNES